MHYGVCTDTSRRQGCFDDQKHGYPSTKHIWAIDGRDIKTAHVVNHESRSMRYDNMQANTWANLSADLVVTIALSIRVFLSAIVSSKMVTWTLWTLWNLRSLVDTIDLSGDNYQHQSTAMDPLVDHRHLCSIEVCNH